MAPWIITYHHRHGNDAWLVWQDSAPDLDEVAAGLEDFEHGREEYLEVFGTGELPPAIAAAPDLLARLDGLLEQAEAMYAQLIQVDNESTSQEPTPEALPAALRVVWADALDEIDNARAAIAKATK